MGHGYSGKGKNKRSAVKQIRSVYAAETHDILYKTPKSGHGYNGPREKPGVNSIVFNPKTYGKY